jgi:NAD(P)-dependent dehydrogenase (short-subunit alcohol dehydrogenase family)
VALKSGGESGVGRAVAVHMARESADIAIVYLEEDDDAIETAKFVEAEGRRCLTISWSRPSFSSRRKTLPT